MLEIAVLLLNEIMRRQVEATLSKRKNHVIVNKPITIDNVVEGTRKAIELGMNIVVAGGYQASDVKLYTSIPTAEVIMAAQELGLLIVRAKKMVNKPLPRIGAFCWEGMLYDTTYFEQLYEVKTTTCHPENQNDWYELVKHGIAEGIDVLIGGEKRMCYAMQKDLPSVFLSVTGEPTEIAINQAETMYEVAKSEKRGYTQLFIVLDSSFNGIAKIRVNGQIQTMDRMMEKMLKTSVKSAAGRHASEAMPFIDRGKIGKVLAGEKETYSTFTSNEKNAMVAIVKPIVVERVVTDTIVSCNQTMRLDWSGGRTEEKLLAGFVAHENLDHMLLKRPGFKNAVAPAKVYAQSSSSILMGGYSYEKLGQLCRGVHNYSLRRSGSLVAANTGNMPVEHQVHVSSGISEADFGKKQRGTLPKTNDETLVMRAVDKLKLPAQRYFPNAIRKKRFGPLGIENESIQRVNTHITARTSKGLKKMVNEERFRKDLYYLLKAFGITLSKASERRMDPETLLDEYYKKCLEHHARYHVLTPEARERILGFQWDSNDIQLESFYEHMVLTVTKREISGEYVQDLLGSLYDLSEQEVKTPQTSSGRGFLKKAKIKDIRDALVRYNGNRMLMAKYLNISTSALWGYMKKYGIQP